MHLARCFSPLKTGVTTLTSGMFELCIATILVRCCLNGRLRPVCSWGPHGETYSPSRFGGDGRRLAANLLRRSVTECRKVERDLKGARRVAPFVRRSPVECGFP